MKSRLSKYLSEEDIKSITAKITEVEEHTSGEIRVSLRKSRAWSERNLSLHDLAVKEFARLGMQKTKDLTGVLMLLLMSERKFQIIADEGINAKVESGTWERVAEAMSLRFREGNFGKGICDAIEAVGAELKTYFPRKPDDRNELSNDIIEQ